jgi:hypothetical protein
VIGMDRGASPFPTGYLTTSSTRPTQGPDRAPPAGSILLIGGVVAHNEERNLEGAVRSLLDQELPAGASWGSLWIVASGCTDGTVAVARRLAAVDPRVQLLVEIDRQGKSEALGEIFRRARGDALILLNSDARAAPGAVGELLLSVRGRAPPYAVMGRPVVPGHATGPLSGMLGLQWELHDELHRELLGSGHGTHLSDELLLVSLRGVPGIPAGIVNDGSYLGAWLTAHGGQLLYAPGALVSIQVPSSLRDHLRQRRRIRFGHRQVTQMLGVTPTTLPQYATRAPRAALRLLGRAVARRDAGVREFLGLLTAEVLAGWLTAWDRINPRRDHVRWERIAPPSHGVLDQRDPVTPPDDDSVPGRTYPVTSVETGSLLERRLESVLGVAAEFGSGITLDRLLKLMPLEGPGSTSDLRIWLQWHPHLARIDGERVFAPGGFPDRNPAREARAARYRRAAEELLGSHLAPVRPILCCLAISGSVAYGEPDAGDDLDLFVVTRPGALWLFLAFVYVRLRLRPPQPAEAGARPCFNYVFEDRSAREAFARDQGFLFAREALSVRVLLGESYYAGLLRSADWLNSELPRWNLGGEIREPEPFPTPAPWPLRLLNLGVYPLVASYLQLIGILRNRNRAPNADRASGFRTVTTLRHLAFASDRFEHLRVRYARAARAPPVPGGDLPVPPVTLRRSMARNLVRPGIRWGLRENRSAAGPRSVVGSMRSRWKGSGKLRGRDHR